MGSEKFFVCCACERLTLASSSFLFCDGLLCNSFLDSLANSLFWSCFAHCLLNCFFWSRLLFCHWHRKERRSCVPLSYGIDVRCMRPCNRSRKKYTTYVWMSTIFFDQKNPDFTGCFLFVEKSFYTKCFYAVLYAPYAYGGC